MDMYATISGKEFNNIYENSNFYKFLNNNFKHYGFKYRLGLNIDTNDFYPHDKCSKGGLYFTDDKNCEMYYYCYENYIAIIEIPDDALVYKEDLKYKANKIIIKEIIHFNNNISRTTLKIFINGINYAKFNKSNNILLDIVKYDGNILECIYEQTHEICLEAVKQKSNALKSAKAQTYEICAGIKAVLTKKLDNYI